MKIIFRTVMTALCLLIASHALQAQTEQTQLNQVELMKQFVGTWSMDIVKDSAKLTVEILPFGSAMVGSVKIMVKDKTVREGRWLWGYNPDYDKFIAAEVSDNSPDISLYTYSFTSHNIAEKIETGDIPNPDPTSLISRFEFRTPDLILQTVSKNNRILSSFTITRAKK